MPLTLLNNKPCTGTSILDSQARGVSTACNKLANLIIVSVAVSGYDYAHFLVALPWCSLHIADLYTARSVVIVVFFS